jgi:urease accessory protein
MFDAISRSERSLARDADLERVDGAIRIAFAPGLTELYQRSPCRVLMPRVDGRASGEAVLINTAGGIAGGDRLSFEMSAARGARPLFTTQAAEKIYRALDASARIETRLSATDGARLEWLPQETIVFDGGQLERSLEISLSGGSQILALEALVLGRAAHGETLSHGSIHDHWRVRRDGALVWADNFRLDGDIAAQIRRPALLDGARAVATAIYAAPDAGARIEEAREALSDAPAGATVIDDLLIVRIATHDAAALREAVRRLLFVLRDGAETPRVWRM